MVALSASAVRTTKLCGDWLYPSQNRFLAVVTLSLDHQLSISSQISVNFAAAEVGE
mgnify:CR=1 FL=1